MFNRVAVELMAIVQKDIKRKNETDLVISM